MNHFFAKIMMLVPFIALYQTGHLSLAWCIVWSIGIIMFCLGNDAARQQRTPHYVVYIRMTLFMLAFLLGAEWLIQTALNREFAGYWTAALAAYLAAFILMACSMLAHSGMAWAVMNDDPKYQSLKAKGFDFFLDNLPETLNPDNDLERETGLKEPQYNGFVPPKNWLYQCPRCGARVEKQIDVCWNCQYGADGNSADYYQRWGNTPGPYAPLPTDEE